jgi:hypothetical protein
METILDEDAPENSAFPSPRKLKPLKLPIRRQLVFPPKEQPSQEDMNQLIYPEVARNGGEGGAAV